MQTPTDQDRRIAEQLHSRAGPRFSKTDSRYWLTRVYKPRNSRGSASPHYAFQVQFRGRHLTFGLHTGNREAAARKAAAIYADIAILGVEQALDKHRPTSPKPERIASVGEYLAAARSVMEVRPVTFAGYAGCLRQIAAEILCPSHGRETKATRASVEAASLEILTSEAVQAWRLSFVARARGDARRERTARISANSIIRQAASLFSRKVVKFLGALKLPEPRPFSEVEYFKRESSRYISRIDAGDLLRKARQELAEKHPDAFLVVLIALLAGLRRSELDTLLWSNVDFDGDRIIVDSSEHGRLKTPESQGAVDIDQHTVEILRGFRARGTSRFVVEGGRESPNSGRTWGRYRCGATFNYVIWWLRRHGVDTAKPLHTLRRESGCLIAQQHGLFPAQQHLRHRDISTTAHFYLDRKSKTPIDTAALLKASTNSPQNVVPMPGSLPSESKRGSKRKTAS